MSEDVIYSDNDVSISTSRIVIRGTTYALRNITSVKMTWTPAKRGCAIAILFMGVLFLIVGITSAGDRDKGALAGGLVFGLVFGVGGFLWMRAAKTTYHVTIASSSGEAKALTAKRKDYIEKIVAAINEAIVRYR